MSYMNKLSKVEELLFSDDRNRDVMLEKAIKSGKEIELLDYVSQYFYDDIVTQKEVDFMLKEYSDAISRKFDKFSAKMYAIKKGFENMYSRKDAEFTKYS